MLAWRPVLSVSTQGLMRSLAGPDCHGLGCRVLTRNLAPAGKAKRYTSLITFDQALMERRFALTRVGARFWVGCMPSTFLSQCQYFVLRRSS